MLTIGDLHVKVDGQELLRGVNLTIPSGEVHALLGPNGCGKTSLLMAIAGYPQYQVTTGQICFAGMDVIGMNLTERARLGIGLAQQRPPTLNGVRLHDLIEYIRPKEWVLPQAIEDWIKAFHLEPLLERSLNAGFSGGEIKRCELFQLLITQPKFAMLDEPDSGVDLETLPLVGRMVNALLFNHSARSSSGSAALIITHTGYILDYVAVDRAHIMLAGRIQCSGDPRSLLSEIRHSGFEGCVQAVRKDSLNIPEVVQ